MLKTVVAVEIEVKFQQQIHACFLNTCMKYMYVILISYQQVFQEVHLMHVKNLAKMIVSSPPFWFDIFCLKIMITRYFSENFAVYNQP